MSGRRDAQLARLREAEGTPDSGLDAALEVLARAADFEVARAALRLAGRAGPFDPRLPGVIRARYAWIEEAPLRRDAGGLERVALLDAIRPVATLDDIPLLERAARTVEFLPPGRNEVCARLRAAALLALAEAEAELARWHAVRLLVDPWTDAMTGEPGLTAARLLAAQDRTLPLFLLAMDPAPHPPDLVSECLRLLEGLPASLLADLVARHGETEDDLVLVGLFDLLLSHPAGTEHEERIVAFLRETERLEVFHYLVATIVARRKTALVRALLDQAERERDPARAHSLSEALALRPDSPERDAALAALDRVLAPGR